MALSSVSRVLIALACFGAGISGASAQEVTKLGSFNDWAAWKSTDANGEICYVASNPTDKQPADVNHGEVHFFVINRKGLGTRLEVQTLMGYPLKTGSVPSVTVDGKAYNMVVDGQAAWLASANDEPGFVENMKKGRQLVVKAVSERGTNTSYTYSLSGVTAALNEVNKACP